MCYGENRALWGWLTMGEGSYNFSFCGQCRSHWEGARNLSKDLIRCLPKKAFPAFLTLIYFSYFHSLLSYLAQSASSFSVITHIPPVAAMLVPFLSQPPGRLSTQAVKSYSLSSYFVEHEVLNTILFNSIFAITLLDLSIMTTPIFQMRKEIKVIYFYLCCIIKLCKQWDLNPVELTQNLSFLSTKLYCFLVFFFFYSQLN